MNGTVTPRPAILFVVVLTLLFAWVLVHWPWVVFWAVISSLVGMVIFYALLNWNARLDARYRGRR